MNILIVSCIFPPETPVTGKTSLDLANFLDNKGNNVRVICPKPSRNCSSENYNRNQFNFKIKRLFSLPSKRSSMLSRFLENITFGLSSFKYIIFSKRFDVIYSNSWPIFATGLVILASKIKKNKIIISVNDLYPESLITQERIRENRFIYKIILNIDKFISRNANHIIVLDNLFKSKLLKTRGIKKNKITVINNWIKETEITLLPKLYSRNKIQKLLNHNFSNDDRLCIYGGNIGKASGLDEFIRNIPFIDKSIKFIFAGEGTLLDELKQLTKKMDLSERVFFISPWPLRLTSTVFASADFLLLTTAIGQEFSSIPSKLITYMFSAKPIIMIADKNSPISNELIKANCGFLIKKRTKFAIKKCFEDLIKKNQSILDNMGQSGRNYASINYSYENSINLIYEIIKK